MATYEDPPDSTSKLFNNVNRIEWVPISLTLVEYPKGKFTISNYFYLAKSK